MNNKELYNEYMKSKEIQEHLNKLNENFVFLNDNPILICGDSANIDFEDKEIYYNNDCMVCGKRNRKWREFREKLSDGTLSDPYIMTFECMIDTFGEYCAKKLFDTGVIPDEWV